MGIFARNRQLEQERAPDYLQHVQATAASLERAQHTRDQAIVAARRHHKVAVGRMSSSAKVTPSNCESRVA